MDEASHRVVTIRARVTRSDEALYKTAAARLELTLSEYLRLAADEKAERDLGLTVGLDLPPITERVRDDDDDALAPPPIEFPAFP